MEEKKVFKRSNSFRTLFNSRNPGKSFFRRYNNSSSDAFIGFLKKTKGFTLIELIVVVGILSILAVVGIAALNPVEQFKKASDSRRKSDLAQIQKAVEVYYQDNGSYPLSDSYMITIPAQSGGTTIIDWGKSWIPYMNILPKDPANSKNYVYSSTGQSYFIYASLDREGKDPQACNGGVACEKLPSGASCGSGTCNYGVTSPNVSP